jgi:hypothetical protein
VSPTIERPGERTPHDRPVDRQPTFVDLDDLERIARVEIPLVNDVEQPRANDRPDHTPHRHRKRIVLGVAGFLRELHG